MNTIDTTVTTTYIKPGYPENYRSGPHNPYRSVSATVATIYPDRMYETTDYSMLIGMKTGSPVTDDLYRNIEYKYRKFLDEIYDLSFIRTCMFDLNRDFSKLYCDKENIVKEIYNMGMIGFFDFMSAIVTTKLAKDLPFVEFLGEGEIRAMFKALNDELADDFEFDKDILAPELNTLNSFILSKAKKITEDLFEIHSNNMNSVYNNPIKRSTMYTNLSKNCNCKDIKSVIYEALKVLSLTISISAYFDSSVMEMSRILIEPIESLFKNKTVTKLSDTYYIDYFSNVVAPLLYKDDEFKFDLYAYDRQGSEWKRTKLDDVIMSKVYNEEKLNDYLKMEKHTEYDSEVDLYNPAYKVSYLNFNIVLLYILESINLNKVITKEDLVSDVSSVQNEFIRIEDILEIM